MSKYDVIYSITAHESPDCVWNLVDNIKKYHKDKNVLIVFHVNTVLEKLLPLYDNAREGVIFNPEVIDKYKYTSDIFLAHLSNYRLIKEEKFDLFCTLASNCMFVREPNWKLIEKETPGLYPGRTSGKFAVPDTTKAFWDDFVKNHHLVDLFSEHEVVPVLKNHEGTYYKKAVFNYIFWFYILGKVDKKSFTNDVLAFEEVLFPSMEKYATGQVSRRFCSLCPDITEAQILEVAETGGCSALPGDWHNIVKVPRSMENPLRKLVNQLP